MQKDNKKPLQRCPECGGVLDSYYSEYKDDMYCVKSKCVDCDFKMKEMYRYEQWKRDTGRDECFS